MKTKALKLSRLKIVGVGLMSAMIGLSTYNQVQAAASANTTASALARVISSIAISKLTDLNFGDGVPGDAAKEVDATTGAAARASFTVTGQASTPYNISLPADGTIVMKTGAGTTPQTQIAVDSFESSPSGSGTLSGGGSQTLYVGATRAALLSDQQAGDYTATFTVTVTYQ